MYTLGQNPPEQKVRMHAIRPFGSSLHYGKFNGGVQDGANKEEITASNMIPAVKCGTNYVR